jgi:hypothetical protein
VEDPYDQREYVGAVGHEQPDALLLAHETVPSEGCFPKLSILQSWKTCSAISLERRLGVVLRCRRIGRSAWWLLSAFTLFADSRELVVADSAWRQS